MQLIVPLDFGALKPSEPSQWYPDDTGHGCRLRVLRLEGGVQAFGEETCDTIVFAARSSFAVTIDGKEESLADEGLLFLPAGTRAAVNGTADGVLLEILVPLAGRPPTRSPRIAQVDESRFEGGGFAYQSLLDRSTGSIAMRMNILRVAPGAGSPGYHIHAFDQIYVLLEGEMIVDIGIDRFAATAPAIVILPAGIVHRNFNQGPGIERHVTLLVPEPPEGAIFDYAVTIHSREAELQTSLPEPWSDD